jgi:acyl carrier protein
VVPVPVQPAAPAPAAAVANSKLSQTLVQIVSDKTGYPVEMLELDMDMEADLGIDSIKRVEILGALQEQFPGMAKPNPEMMGDVRTLGQIAQTMLTLLGGEAPAAPAVTTIEVVAQPVAAPPEPQPEPAFTMIAEPAQKVMDSTAIELSQTLVQIVSDKTGYPVEMLELDMDMEADLGIDSIKRVEILGALAECFPQMPKPTPESIGEIRTLGQIAEVMGRQMRELVLEKKLR